ncbi:SMI1/KNR4 family protein [Vibrio rotiferianus]|uniref:SMI1/KNR4 family protein n=1 Tax=Vibrio rotiferianus TaxID=190895 RepID=UPI0005EE678E|nr:SMI1/KNR4 family protein [Vibrio rotiferianus]
MNNFREFVTKNEIWFRGKCPETDTSLDRVERELNIKLPSEIRWLLKEYGYWHGTGISNIEESVEVTKNARAHVQLPNNYIVLYDNQDNGVILLNTELDSVRGEHQVIDSGWESIPEKLNNETLYPNFMAYTKIVIKTEADFLDEEYVEYKE